MAAPASLAEGARPAANPAQRGFGHVTTWIFDLDNTLYPAECDLFAQVDTRMSSFIARYLDVHYDDARYLQKHYYRQYGTTLSGLMHVHDMDPKAFLDYVHDIDLSPVPESPRLSAAIERLPGRKLIFTNGTVRHAERVAAKLGVLHHFEGIFDIVGCDYVPKPHAPAYAKFLHAHGVEPMSAAMFEDMPHNLEQPHALGMATVLVKSSYFDHPIQHEIAAWRQPPAHIHHVTEDLLGFLEGVGSMPKGVVASCQPRAGNNAGPV